MKTPRSVDLVITNRCNLRCRYCSHFGGPGDVGRDLPTGEWILFFEELNRCSVLEVTIGGGEPFCRDDLKDLVMGIVRNRMRFDILSNGTLVTDELAGFLSSTGRCNGVQISIDGSTPSAHDGFRGEGNFHRAIQGVEALRTHNVPVSVRVTIHRQNVRDLEAIAAFLLDDMGLPAFSTNSASFLGLCRRNAAQVQLSVDEQALAMESLVRLCGQYPGRISASAGPLAEATAWLMMERARRERRGPSPAGGYLNGCGGVMNKLAVRADGVMVPCSQMSHITLGRINRDPLAETWQNHPQLRRLRERSGIPLRDFEFCRGCDYVDYCTGNCPALAYTMTGNEYHPSPDACLRRFLEAGGRLPEEKGPSLAG